MSLSLFLKNGQMTMRWNLDKHIQNGALHLSRLHLSPLVGTLDFFLRFWFNHQGHCSHKWQVSQGASFSIWLARGNASQQVHFSKEGWKLITRLRQAMRLHVISSRWRISQTEARAFRTSRKGGIDALEPNCPSHRRPQTEKRKSAKSDKRKTMSLKNTNWQSWGRR